MMLSSFQEVVHFDVDNYFLADPAQLLESHAYKSTGAVFWPANGCNVVAVLASTWRLFRMQPPEGWPESRDTHISKCSPQWPLQVQGGTIMMDKKRAWRGAYMTTFINIHAYFSRAHFTGNRMRFYFGFEAARVEYSLHRFALNGLGRHELFGRENKSAICANSNAERHPDTGDIIAAHRIFHKFTSPHAFAREGGNHAIWLYVVEQDPHMPWTGLKATSIAVSKDLKQLPRARHPSLCRVPTSKPRIEYLASDSVCVL